MYLYWIYKKNTTHKHSHFYKVLIFISTIIIKNCCLTFHKSNLLNSKTGYFILAAVSGSVALIPNELMTTLITVIRKTCKNKFIKIKIIMCIANLRGVLWFGFSQFSEAGYFFFSRQKKLPMHRGLA